MIRTVARTVNSTTSAIGRNDPLGAFWVGRTRRILHSEWQIPSLLDIADTETADNWTRQ